MVVVTNETDVTCDLFDNQDQCVSKNLVVVLLLSLLLLFIFYFIITTTIELKHVEPQNPLDGKRRPLKCSR